MNTLQQNSVKNFQNIAFNSPPCYLDFSESGESIDRQMWELRSVQMLMVADGNIVRMKTSLQICYYSTRRYIL